ncbi:MAG: biopolymer transport protein ExbB [Bradymonadia bacterium]|jgi:biopolymer transport protein ExbB
MRDAFEFLALGGPIIAVLALCSLVATTLLFERLWYLQKQRIVPARFQELVRQHLRAGRHVEAGALCEASDTPIARIIGAGIKQQHAGRARVREALEDRGRQEATRLERFLGVLSAIATVSPLLGLLGTITGMIKTFQSVTENVGAQAMSAGVLANGIWEALISTAAGLCVAIPVFVAHRLLAGRVDALTTSLEEGALAALDDLDRLGDVAEATP